MYDEHGGYFEHVPPLRGGPGRDRLIGGSGGDKSIP
jgi:hypothetical protein